MPLKTLVGNHRYFNLGNENYQNHIALLDLITDYITYFFERLLNRSEKGMLKMICGKKISEGKSKKELLKSVGLTVGIDERVRESCLRRYGHVLRRKDDEGIKKSLMFAVESNRGRGKPPIRWRDMAKRIAMKRGLTDEDAYDRLYWRKRLRE